MSDSEVLYLESDEEITTAIDKMTALDGAKISIVVPKRSTLLQSIVNLKLLKKSAADSGKEIVLVTADRTATHLAGQLGLAVAASLKTSPVVPTATKMAAPISEEIVEGDEDATEAAAVAASAAAGAATGVQPSIRPKSPKPDFAKPVTVRSLSDSPAVPDSAAGSKLKVPNFNILQKRLLIAAGVVAFIALLVAANIFLTTAKVTLFARGTAVPASFDFSVDPDLRDSDPAKAALAGQKLEISQDLTGSFTATGKKDVGTKAHGTMTITNKTNSERTLVAGTRFQSGDKIFKSDVDVSAPAAHLGPFFNPIAGTATVAVTADVAGDQYNLAPTHYTIPALSVTDQTFIYADGNQMSGGTTKEVAVVTAADVDKAKTDLLDSRQADIKKQLEAKAASGYQPLPDSFNQAPGDATSNPAIDSEATQASLTLHVVYDELAVNQSDYKAMVKAGEQKLIGPGNQIYDDGTTDSKLTPGKRDPTGRQDFGFSAQAYAGAKLDTAVIAKQLSGKRYGDAADLAAKLPGVERAEISLTPGWSSELPIITSHIKIEIKIAAKG